MASKNIPEIHPAVDAGNPQSKRTFSEATQQAVASATALSNVYKHRKKKKATLAMLLRLVVAVALCALVVVLRACGHVSAEVTFVGLLILEAWVMLWVGAWVQFMWCKEGVLK